MPDNQKTEAPEDGRLIFTFLSEIGIIAQLSRALLEERNPDGLSMPQFSVLNHLVRLGDKPSPLTLAKAFQLPKTSMTHTLATLEKQALIEMRPNPDDGRSKLIHITRAGQAARERTIDAMLPDLAQLGVDVGVVNIKAALPLLEKARQQLDSYRNDD